MCPCEHHVYLIICYIPLILDSMFLCPKCCVITAFLRNAFIFLPEFFFAGVCAFYGILFVIPYNLIEL